MTHDYIFSSDPDVKKKKLAPLRKLYGLKQLKVECNCNMPKATMILCYHTPTDSYYIRSYDRKEHAEHCYYHHETNDRQSPGSFYERGFQKKENGIIEIKLDGQDYRLEKKNKSNLKTTALIREIALPTSGGVSTHRPSIYAMMWRLITEAWNDLVQFSHHKGFSYPTNNALPVYNRLVNHTVKSYSLKDISLSELLYKGEAPGRVFGIEKANNFKSAAFTMLLLTCSVEPLSEELYRLTLHSPASNQPREIDVPAVLYEKALRTIRGMAGPYFAGGFVQSMGFGETPQFISFGLVPINEYGVPVESSYERAMYTLLCKQKRPFMKCLESSYPSWNGFVPDGLLIDTKPQTIIEIFGMSESVVPYHIQRAIKIERFSNLYPSFKFWYWDAFKGEVPPSLP